VSVTVTWANFDALADCIGRIPLIRQSLSQPDRAVSPKGIYVPINYTFPLTTMTSLSPRKKSNWTKGSGSIPPLPERITAIGASSASVADFDFKIKTRDSQCVVSGSSTSFMTGLACGPGIQATHIVPKSHWLAYPLAQDDYANNDYLLTVRTSKPADSEATSADADAAKTILKRRYTATWSLSNGISLRSDIRAVHDARLLAIHPKTHEVRLFAPIEWLLPYHGVKAKLPPLGGPDKRALKFHYDQCVLENVCAKTFDSNPPGIDELMRLPAIGELKRAGLMLKPVAGPRDLVLGPQRNEDDDDET